MLDCLQPGTLKAVGRMLMMIDQNGAELVAMRVDLPLWKTS